jgi:hypothetical protein
MGRSWFGGPFDVSVILPVVDPDPIGDGPWAQEGGPEDIGITITSQIPSAETSVEENLNHFFLGSRSSVCSVMLGFRSQESQSFCLFMEVDIYTVGIL